MRDEELDDLLALAARARPEPSPSLLGRVLADAEAEQVVPRPLAAPPRRVSALSRLAAVFGGGPVLAGVCSTVVLGLALGYMNPAAADYLTGGLVASETLDLFPTADTLTTEG